MPAIPLIMGVINVTPDSFSDGGLWLDVEAAVAHGKQLAAEGADVLDIGGESTRPGAEPVSVDEELARVIPVIEELSDSARISIDTRKPEVATAAVAAGATLINDVSASLWRVAAETGAGWVAMHMQGDPRTMQHQPTYGDVVVEVRDFLLEHAQQARSAGVQEVWIDPGIGFGKTLEHNLLLLRHISTLRDAGFPVLIGASRKTMLGELTAVDGVRPPVEDRFEASIAVAVWAMSNGAGMIRVHDVRATVRATQVIKAIQTAEDSDKWHPPVPRGRAPRMKEDGRAVRGLHSERNTRGRAPRMKEDGRAVRGLHSERTKGAVA